MCGSYFKRVGVCNPVDKIVEIAKQNGAKVLLDAAQSAPHQKIDFAEIGADFMAFSAHKMCGPTGIGALLVDEEAFDEMQPFMGGGDMIETVSIHGSTYQQNEQKFEADTKNSRGNRLDRGDKMAKLGRYHY